MTTWHFWSFLAHFSLEWEIFQTNVVEEMKTHILYSISCFGKSSRLWDNLESIAERVRPQMTIWRMRIACWTPRASNTHSGCLMLIAFPQHQWLHERASMLRYTYIAWLVSIYVVVQISEFYIKCLISLPFQYSRGRCVIIIIIINIDDDD